MSGTQPAPISITPPLSEGNCLILPFNESDSSWDIQLFQFEIEEGFGHLWGHNLTQSTAQRISAGKPNLFGTFKLSDTKSNIVRKEDMKMFTLPFSIKRGKYAQYTLPGEIVQDLYDRDYPQFRYCFRINNPLFRTFIYGTK